METPNPAESVRAWLTTPFLADLSITWWPLSQFGVADVVKVLGAAIFAAVGAVLIIGAVRVPPVAAYVRDSILFGSPQPTPKILFLKTWGVITFGLVIILSVVPMTHGGLVAAALAAATFGSMLVLTPHGLKVTLLLAWGLLFVLLFRVAVPNLETIRTATAEPETTLRTVAIALLGPIAVALLALLIGRIAPWLTTSFVDVVRYVDTSPRSYEVRRDIRAGLVDLLARLHENDYDRIVIVAHSLGSYIAYDAICSLWFARISGTGASIGDAPEREPGESDEAWRDRYRQQQADDFASLSKRTLSADGRREPRWRISDLVTFGSPMYMAHRLLTKTRREYEERKRRRDFFTCPPPDDATITVGVLEDVDAQDARRDIAAFGVVRWTNLWYRTRLGFFGDPFGGRLAPLFGQGVLDRIVTDGWRSLVPYGAHALYTKSPRDTVSFATAVTDAIIPPPAQ